MTLEFVIESRRRPAGEFKWNDDNVAQMKKRWLEGASATEIALELGCKSRSAVLGRIHRDQRKEFSADMAKRAPSHAPRANKPRGDCGGGSVTSINAKKERGQNAGLNFKRPKTRIDFDDPTLVATVIPAAQRRTLLELDGSCCHWPIGDPADPAFFFCGGPALTGFPYCAFHSRVAYQPPNSRRGHMRRSSF